MYRINFSQDYGYVIGGEYKKSESAQSKSAKRKKMRMETGKELEQNIMAIISDFEDGISTTKLIDEYESRFRFPQGREKITGAKRDVIGKIEYLIEKQKISFYGGRLFLARGTGD